MARSTTGNMLGKAAQGHDDIYDAPSEYAMRLKIASDKVKEILDDPMNYLSLILRVQDGDLLYVLETIVAQCAEYDTRAQAIEMTALPHTFHDFNPSEDESSLAHIDSLVGEERATIVKMIDATDLFTPRSYNNKHVPNRTCPKCGGLLIVKERRLRQRGKADYVTNFVACTMYERTGCKHTEEFTTQIKESVDSVVYNIDIEF